MILNFLEAFSVHPLNDVVITDVLVNPVTTPVVITSFNPVAAKSLAVSIRVIFRPTIPASNGVPEAAFNVYAVAGASV